MVLSLHDWAALTFLQSPLSRQSSARLLHGVVGRQVAEELVVEKPLFPPLGLDQTWLWVAVLRLWTCGIALHLHVSPARALKALGGRMNDSHLATVDADMV